MNVWHLPMYDDTILDNLEDCPLSSNIFDDSYLLGNEYHPICSEMDRNGSQPPIYIPIFGQFLKTSRELSKELVSIFILPFAVVALFLKCQQISLTLGNVYQNLDNLFHEDHFEIAKNVISFAGFTINIAYLVRLPSLVMWLEQHSINSSKFCNLLLKQKGKWYAIKVFLKYDGNGPLLDKKFWKRCKGHINIPRQYEV
ncbi:11773_t:CDS:2 [Ambispora leptoticha]|uniref:11773_t:CDS:1 n=1 Tax=Ambispora leptoticha TaxID=144679 RepID=A0A9N8ZJW0_9GLOM|nr:11773_t:CDS:2 [Ambispora leptoticha]